MSICCDRDVKTPFCPYCGKDMRPKTPLVELRKHCARYLHGYERNIEYCKNTGGSALQAIPSYERLIVKWRVWVEALDKANNMESLAATSDSQEVTGQPRKRRRRGANKASILTWFQEHPSQAIGQSEMAAVIGIHPSSARVVLNILEGKKVIERTPDKQWKKAGDSPGERR